MTVEDIIERVYRRYLTPAFDQPVASALNAGITDTATTLTVKPFSSIEYMDAISAGTLIEIDYELMQVVSVIDPASNDPNATADVTVTRGAYGTEAVAHDADARVIINPPFIKHDVRLAVFEEIENLYPDLTLVKTEDYDSYPIELDDDFVELVEVVMILANARVPIHGAYVHYDSSGSPVLDVGQLVNGGIVRVTYNAAPQRPTRATQQLSQLNVLDRWADIVAMAAAAQMVTGQNISDLHIDYLTEVGEAAVTEGVDPQSLGTDLRRNRAIALQQERRRIHSTRRVWVNLRSPLGL